MSARKHPIGSTIETIKAMLADNPGISGREIARRLDCHPSNIHHLLHKIRSNGAEPTIEQPEFTVHVPPSPELSAEELIEIRRRQFSQKEEYENERKLIKINIHSDEPMGILHFGDPHVDDDGCDWDMLLRDIDLIRSTSGLYCANVGDTTNNWVGRLAKLYAAQSTSSKQAWILAEWFIRRLEGRWLYMVGGNHDCHDPETECLTRRGWKRFEDIDPDTDLVWTYDEDLGGYRWTQILKKIVKDHDGEMVRVRTRSISQFITPTHRFLWHHHKKNPGMMRYSTADNIPSKPCVPVCGSRPELEQSWRKVNLPEPWIRLAGWILTDGSIQWDGNSPRVSIWQSKKVEELKTIIGMAGLVASWTTRNRPIKEICGKTLLKDPLPQTEFRFDADTSRKIIETLHIKKGELPPWAFECDDPTFDILLDSLIDGDGCWDGSSPEEKRCAVLHGTKQFLDYVQACAVTHGWSARISVARGKDYRLNLTRRKSLMFYKSKAVSTEHYAGKVWCLTVPTGNFTIRRDGAVSVSGNCWSGDADPLQWISKSVRALYEPSEARIALVYPNGRQVRVNCRHDFKGFSMWNPAHGPGRAAQLGVRDHIEICGHKHVSAYLPLVDPEDALHERTICHAIQVASYKRYDRYAREKGFRDQSISPCVVTIINPKADHPADLVQVFWNPPTAVKYLKMLRGEL